MFFERSTSTCVVLQAVKHSLQLNSYRGCIIIIIDEIFCSSVSQSNGRTFWCPPRSLREIAVHLQQDHKWPWGRGRVNSLVNSRFLFFCPNFFLQLVYDGFGIRILSVIVQSLKSTFSFDEI